ncbi:MAG: HAMP domain-containing histidine kinase [Lachnospiraceae bacterium]|nr:HAMP domain-containing histidine kinase [Lachnospiraceae bacterium]
MKLKHRLIIAFVILAIVPLLLYGTVFPDALGVPNIGMNIPEGAPASVVREKTADVFISVVLILSLISLLLILWIYHGVMSKIDVLVTGADKIKEGDLDFSIELKGRDELAAVGVAFEEMRIRLKADAHRRLEAERTQRQLVSNIAHDLKTPLTAIRGYTEGLLDGVADTPAKRLAYCTTIHNKAKEMDALLNELTSYSQLDANRIPYSFQRLKVRDYFFGLAEDMRIDLENQNARLIYYNYVEEEAMLVADPVQIGRVFQNCVDNSIKYAKKDVPLEIHFGIWPEGDFVHIEMKDNGIGIAEQDLPRVFERLYRGDASRTSAGGSGIGLSIVKKIVDDHGRSVEVLSRLGEGTTVSFMLKKIKNRGGEG